MKQIKMKIRKILSVILLIVGGIHIAILGADETDQVGNSYKTVKIGDQEWMAENLNTDQFRNGDIIAEAKSRIEWQKAFFSKEPVWSYYGYDPANGQKYGKMYNWYAVVDPRGLAPAGWHVPSDAEWTQLTDYLGGEVISGTKLKSSRGWKENGNGNNQSQFSGLPGGACADDGYLGSIGYLGVWWSTTEDTCYYYDPDAYAWYRYLFFSKGEINRYSHSKGNGFSVRCIRD